MSRFLILPLGLAIIGLMHRGLWVWLVRDPNLPQPWRRIGTLALVFLGALAPLGMAALMLMRHPQAQLFAVGVFAWLGLALLLITLLLAVRVPLGLWFRMKKVDAQRRVFISRAVAGTASLATAGASVFALRSATGPAEVTETEVKLARLPQKLSGFTIAQISDLHVGPTIREKEVARVVEQVNALKPDLIALTGDMMDGSVANLGPIVGQLARMQSRYGLYFVTGNHEVYSGLEAWCTELSRVGIRVLRNERVTIGSDVSFDLAGVDDVSAGGDLGKALAGRDPDRSLVLLAHQPKRDLFHEAVAAGVELQLSGHTHGGQIAPFNAVVKLAFPYLAGLYRHEAGQVYVSRGTGYWGPPLRLASAPEIAKLVLT